MLAINIFANINVCTYYNTVRGRPSQLLDSHVDQAFPKMQSLNHEFKTHPTVP